MRFQICGPGPASDEADPQAPLLHFAAKNSTENTFLQLLQNTSEQEKKVPDARRTITAV